MKWIVCFFVAMMLGCGVEASEMTDAQAKDFAENVKYVQDKRTGICFAFVASEKARSTKESGMGMTMVSCEQVKDFLVN